MFQTDSRTSCVAALAALAVTACNQNEPEPATAASTTPVAPSPAPAPAPEPTAAPAPAPEPAGCNAKASRADKKRDLAAKPTTKIVGGKPAEDAAWPFAVALAFEQSGKLKQYCGGSLIGDRWVLTAAHCEVRTTEKAIVGRHDLTKEGDGKAHAIKRVLNHGAYDANTNDNDIALVELAEPSTAATVTPYSGALVASGDSTVIGWGLLKEGGEPSPLLQQVTVPVVTNSVCSTGYASDHVSITTNMLCAGLATGGKDSCQGDSGGPLLVKGPGDTWQQAGVVSFGIGCAQPNRFGVYTRVSKFASWIQACTKS